MNSSKVHENRKFVKCTMNTRDQCYPATADDGAGAAGVFELRDVGQGRAKIKIKIKTPRIPQPPQLPFDAAGAGERQGMSLSPRIIPERYSIRNPRR